MFLDRRDFNQVLDLHVKPASVEVVSTPQVVDLLIKDGVGRLDLMWRTTISGGGRVRLVSNLRWLEDYRSS